MSTAPINAHAHAERFRLPDEKPCDCAECVEIREARGRPRINVEAVSAASREETGTETTPTPRKSVTPMTIAAAARYLNRTTWAVYQLTERGRLPSAMLNGRRFVALDDVQTLRRAS